MIDDDLDLEVKSDSSVAPRDGNRVANATAENEASKQRIVVEESMEEVYDDEAIEQHRHQIEDEVPALGLGEDMEDDSERFDEEQDEHEADQGWTSAYDTSRMMIKKSSLFFDEYERDDTSASPFDSAKQSQPSLLQPRLTPFSSLKGVHFVSDGERDVQQEESVATWSMTGNATDVDASYRGEFTKRWKGDMGNYDMDDADSPEQLSHSAQGDASQYSDQPTSRSAGVLGTDVKRHPLNDQVSSRMSGCSELTDHGLLMGRSFRVGWSADGSLIHAGLPCVSLGAPSSSNGDARAAGGITIESLSRLCVVNVASSEDNGDPLHFDSRSIFSVDGNREEANVGDAVKAMQQHLSPLMTFHLASTHGQSVANQTQFMEEEDDMNGEDQNHMTLRSPMLSGAMFDSMVEDIIRELDRQISDQRSDDQCSDSSAYLQHVREVWRLLHALYAQTPSLPEGEADSRSMGESQQYSKRIHRRLRISRWLEDEVREDVEAETAQVLQAVQSGYESDSESGLIRIWTFLSGGCIQEACEAALQEGLFHLATLLACARSDAVRMDVKKQLQQWDEERESSLLGEEERKKVVVSDLYLLLSGEVVEPRSWRNRDDRLLSLAAVGKPRFWF